MKRGFFPSNVTSSKLCLITMKFRLICISFSCELKLKMVQLISRDEFEIVIHSDDAFAPVGYVKFKTMHLQDKGIVSCTILMMKLCKLIKEAPFFSK